MEKDQKIKSIFHQPFFAWSIVAFWLLLIFILSSRSSFPVNLNDNQYNEVSSLAHIVLYVFLTKYFFNAFKSINVETGKALIYSFLSTIIYGAFDEWHQSFVPGREMHLSDWLLDVVGSFFVICLLAAKHKISFFKR